MLQKPKIKLSNANILLDQEDSHVLDIVLENAEDFSVNTNNTHVVKSKKAYTRKTKHKLRDF